MAERRLEEKSEKRELRAACRQTRDALSLSARMKKSAEIVEIILKTDVYKKSAKVFAYMPIGSEVNVASLIIAALFDGKVVALPKADKESKTISFFRTTEGSGLIRSALGILEPNPLECDAVSADFETLIIVPLLGFDRQKNRLGYGGGFYDRFLAGRDRLAAMGAGFSEQEVPQVPAEPFDAAVDFIVTEKGVV
jgi:5-formyltetrahydrofolate cyclo-ligase